MELEKIIEHSLEMLEKGATRDEVSRHFPDNCKEIESLFETLDMIGAQSDMAQADSQKLQQIMVLISSEKTNEYAENKGRNKFESIANNLLNMEIKWSLAIPLIFLAIAGAFFFSRPSQAPITLNQTNEYNSSQESEGQLTETAETKTNQDSLIDDLIANLSEEQAIFNNESQETELALETNELNNITQLYEDTEF